jgi:signal transduction histidine kinase
MPSVASPIDRWRPWVDAALVVGAVGVGVAGMAAARSDASVAAAPLTPVMALMAVAVSVPMVWRRRWPLGMVVAAIVAAMAASAVDDRGLFGGQVVVIALVLLFAVGAWCTRVWLAAAVVATLFALAVSGSLHDGNGVAPAVATAVALVLLPVVAGYASRVRRQYVGEVEARLAAAEHDRDERARLAVAEERQRLARELHDVVAHHVSLIGVQAGAARVALERSPERAAAALAAIEASSRAAVGELGQLLEVLAPREGLAPPQPGLHALPALVDRWRAAGVTVEARLTGDPAAVAPTVSLCAYRLVEEALTNVARHSSAASATVRVSIGPMVEVEVIDPGPARSGAAGGSGRGLIGMRERVAACAGTLEVGPVPDGSFRVWASLPAVPS